MKNATWDFRTTSTVNNDEIVRRRKLGGSVSLEVSDPYGWRVLVIPTSEKVWAGQPIPIVLDIEAKTNTRLTDGENPLRFLRIQDGFSKSNPDVTFAEYCLRRYPGMVEVTPPIQPRDLSREARHSTDFRSLNWFGSQFFFTAGQASVVKLLFDNWQSGTPDVGDETLLAAVDPEAPPARLSVLFREHPAWGSLIVAGRTRGSHRLVSPEDLPLSLSNARRESSDNRSERSDGNASAPETRR